MANLIMLRDAAETLAMNESADIPEMEIEKLIFERRILPDVLLLKRQLQTYAKDARIDLVGIDRENNVLVIEIKNEMVNEGIIPQVLRYAVWVDTHPDAIKSIWLQHKEKFADFEFDWDKELKLKILVVAPSFKPSVQRLINRITYPVKLMQFKKFSDTRSGLDYVFVDEIVPETEPPYRPVTATNVYDLPWYMENRSPALAKDFWNLCGKVEAFVKQRRWNLSRNNNKGYVSFKYGFPIVFDVGFFLSKTFTLSVMVPEDVAKQTQVEGHTIYQYLKAKVAEYRVEAGDLDLAPFVPLFEAAYNNTIGKKA